MQTQPFSLRDLPKYECIRARAQRYPNIDPEGLNACVLLMRVATDVMVNIQSLLADHGMSQGRFTVLMLLNRHPDQAISPGELADKAGVTRATMTGLLDGMERDGLILKHDHETDRRMFTVELTPRAKDLLDGMLPGYYERITKLMHPLSVDEKNTLAGILTKLGAAVPVPGPD